MAYIETTREQENIIMTVLQELQSPLSRAAVMIMLEDGMCTQEVKLREYVYAKNTAQALNVMKKDPHNTSSITYYLKQNLKDDEYEKLSSVFYQVTKEHGYMQETVERDEL